MNNRTPRAPLLLILVWLGLSGFADLTGAPRTYDVQLAYRGVLGEAPSECGNRVDFTGYDSLVGTLGGIEYPAGSANDAEYKGRAKRKTRLDFCLTKPKVASRPDELVYCVAHLIGAATMDLELTVYRDEGKGAYLKANPVGAPDSVSVRGDCTQEDMLQLRGEYPSGESAGSPDGQPIYEARAEFTVAGVRRLKVDSFPAKPPETAWGLRVLRVTQ